MRLTEVYINLAERTTHVISLRDYILLRFSEHFSPLLYISVP
jgi:hypothetical protein